MNGIIFDIRRFSIHDGPGIRTAVFFKGCQLRCWWCHNPEGQFPEPEVIINKDRCISNCRECVKICSNNAISKTRTIRIKKEKCELCGKCEKVCPSEAIELIGRKVTAEDVLNEIEKDSAFYKESNGGVTFSGGEPLMQINFLNSLLDECKKRKVHTTLDTSGYAKFETIKPLAKKVDLFLYDLKLMDDRKHKKYTGVSNAHILKNLQMLSKIHKNIEIRIPLITGITDTEENIGQIIKFLAELKSVKNISLLPYHTIGNKKYVRLRRENKMLGAKAPTEKKINSIKALFEKNNFKVKIGG